MLIEDKNGELIAKLIKDNEAEAIVSIGKLMCILAIAYNIVGLLFHFNFFHGSKYVPLIFILLSFLVAIVGMISVKTEGKKSYLTGILTISLLFSVFVINVSTGYRAYLLYCLPIALSCRFYNKKLTTSIGIVSIVLILLTSVINSYLAKQIGVIDLNTVIYENPGNINYINDLCGAVVQTGFNKTAVLLNGIRNTAIPNCIIMSLMTLTCNVYISSCQKLLNLTYSRKEKIATLAKENEEKSELINTMEDFVSKMMKHASSKEEVHDIINSMLQYLGNRLHCERAFVFELKDDFYENTFEWLAPNVKSRSDALKKLPANGLIEAWITKFRNNENIFVNEVEDYKKLSEEMYSTVNTYSLGRLVAAPIIINDEIVGFFGVDNPPSEEMNLISESLDMVEFVISMMIKLKNTNEIIIKNANEDALTGCYNRHALKWAYENNFNKNEPIAVIIADLNGLKKINDTDGHKAGDNYIISSANILKEVFGSKTVYRIGGDEFMVVLTGIVKDEFDSLINSCKELAGKTFSIGYTYQKTVDSSFEQIAKAADIDMYQNKEKFYKESGNDRRAR